MRVFVSKSQIPTLSLILKSLNFETLFIHGIFDAPNFGGDANGLL